MSRIVAIGSSLELAGYGLAGVAVEEADEPDAAQRAWAGLDADVGLVLLTPDAALALSDRAARPDLLSVVLPR
jgi:vacuolar-type H+-ATPase subunit F/Vma7